jgi:hypothetical protein
MRHDALIVGQRVACPACDDRFLARITDGLGRIGVRLAAVVVGRGDSGSEGKNNGASRQSRPPS